jgi:hypothetical protein
MINLLFELILITSLIVLGWNVITQEGMALYRIREWAESKKEDGFGIFSPLLLCIWCMPSIWSVFGFAIANGLGLYDLTWKIILLYPLCVAGGSLVCGMIWTLYELMEQKIKYYTNVEELSYFDLKDRKANFNARKLSPSKKVNA